MAETMNEETQEVPKWLKELEEKRERRLKARLGHEAGAGSPCLSCEDKCPGLDLHFWRKICKNCKCGKEDHDVNDDDIYGWAQFQLLGSKPNKTKKFVLPGRKDAVELEWTPRGQSDVVESYLNDLPLNCLPIKGSQAAQQRKQLLQKQIPLHDIDPTLCHALTEDEVKQMNDYIAHVKQSSVGVGHIMKLNEILRRNVNAQILASRAPMQVPQVESIVLQGVDRANALKNTSISNDVMKPLQDLSLGEKGRYNVPESEQTLLHNPGNIRNIVYDMQYGGRDAQTQPKNIHVPNLPVSNQIDYQTAVNVGGIKDIMYPSNKENQTRDMSEPVHQTVHEKPTDVFTNFSDAVNALYYRNQPTENNAYDPDLDLNVNYKYGSSETHPELSNVGPRNLNKSAANNMPHYAPGKFNTFVEQQNPRTVSNIKDLAYSTYDPASETPLDNRNNRNESVPRNLTSQPLRPANYNPNNELNILEQNLTPVPITVGAINDLEYPTIKSAVEQRDNYWFEPEVIRKNVQFDLTPEEILPSCHRCKRMFDAAAIVIGTDRTDALWHAECFKCNGCNQNLADLMYFYDKESDDIYCGRDYAKIRGIPRCKACDELIFVKEYCLAEDSTFHVKHFCCFECDRPLAGQNYVVEESQPMCLPCFENYKAEKCLACGLTIKPDEQGLHLNSESHFHANDDCFSCVVCRKALLGAKFLFKNKSLYCSGACFGARNGAA